MNMKKEIIGREKEQKELRSWIDSDDSEFIAVYGRRRIGKTFLVRKLFGSDFAFDFIACADGGKAVKGRLHILGGGNSVNHAFAVGKTAAD